MFLRVRQGFGSQTDKRKFACKIERRLGVNTCVVFQNSAFWTNSVYIQAWRCTTTVASSLSREEVRGRLYILLSNNTRPAHSQHFSPQKANFVHVETCVKASLCTLCVCCRPSVKASLSWRVKQPKQKSVREKSKAQPSTRAKTIHQTHGQAGGFESVPFPLKQSILVGSLFSKPPEKFQDFSSTVFFFCGQTDNSSRQVAVEMQILDPMSMRLIGMIPALLLSRMKMVRSKVQETNLLISFQHHKLLHTFLWGFQGLSWYYL